MIRLGKQRSRHEREVVALQTFVRQYARKARDNGGDPNDRQYDRQLRSRIRRMDPESFDALLRDDEDGPDATPSA